MIQSVYEQFAPCITPAQEKFRTPHTRHTRFFSLVIPAKAGIHCLYHEALAKWHPAGIYETIKTIDSRLRGNDDVFYMTDVPSFSAP